MTPDYFRSLYEYTFWAQERLWTCMESLTEAQFSLDLGYSQGTLWDQCFHTMSVECWWPHFLHTNEVLFPDADEVPTRAAMRARWEPVREEIRQYLSTLTVDELARVVRAPFWPKERKSITVWQALLQVVNHSTDHRAQMLAALHGLGAPTVDQDYLTYLFEQP